MTTTDENITLSKSNRTSQTKSQNLCAMHFSTTMGFVGLLSTQAIGAAPTRDTTASEVGGARDIGLVEKEFIRGFKAAYESKLVSHSTIAPLYLLAINFAATDAGSLAKRGCDQAAMTSALRIVTTWGVLISAVSSCSLDAMSDARLQMVARLLVMCGYLALLQSTQQDERMKWHSVKCDLSKRTNFSLKN